MVRTNSRMGYWIWPSAVESSSIHFVVQGGSYCSLRWTWPAPSRTLRTWYRIGGCAPSTLSFFVSLTSASPPPSVPHFSISNSPIFNVLLAFWPGACSHIEKGTLRLSEACPSSQYLQGHRIPARTFGMAMSWCCRGKIVQAGRRCKEGMATDPGALSLPTHPLTIQSMPLSGFLMSISSDV